MLQMVEQQCCACCAPVFHVLSPPERCARQSPTTITNGCIQSVQAECSQCGQRWAHIHSVHCPTIYGPIEHGLPSEPLTKNPQKVYKQCNMVINHIVYEETTRTWKGGGGKDKNKIKVPRTLECRAIRMVRCWT